MLQKMRKAKSCLKLRRRKEEAEEIEDEERKEKPKRGRPRKPRPEDDGVDGFEEMAKDLEAEGRKDDLHEEDEDPLPDEEEGGGDYEVKVFRMLAPLESEESGRSSACRG